MEIFEKISGLIRAKEFSKARELAENIPDDVDKNNVFGMISFYEGKIDDSLKFFEKALKINPTHSDVLFNYSKALFEKEEYFESWRYLTRIAQKTWEIYDMLGDTQLKQDNPAMALHYYKKAYELSKIDELKDKYESIKKQHFKSEKLAIFCLPGLDNFIKDIAEILSHVYQVRLVVSVDSKQIMEAYNWADIVWLEWANEMAVEITNKLPKGNKKLLCRLHGYESLRKDFLNSINWEKIDKMIFVAENVMKTAYENCEKIKEIPLNLIQNGIDLTRYTYAKREKGYNLVFVGHFNYKKNPILAIQILKKLLDIDNRYKLFWAGSIQDERIYRYFTYLLEKLHIKESFSFDGWHNDVNSYLEDKNVFLSTSIHEGYGVAILEAMAKGIKPVIHNFYIAEEFYPKEFIFNTIDEAIEMIKNENYDSERYRSFVEEKCSLENQINQIVKAIESTSSQVKTENPSGQNLCIIDPVQAGIYLKMGRNYEENLENSLASFESYKNDLPPGSLVSDTNVEYMIDFLEKFYGRGVPYTKTLYYAFLHDVYKKGLYSLPPEVIIKKFIDLYESVKLSGKILKPMVAFINDGNLKGVSFENGEKRSVDIAESVKFWTVSGRHRVAIANYLGHKKIPAYILKNRFLSEEGKIFSIMPAYWKYYIESQEKHYRTFIESVYVGIFDGTYQIQQTDPEKKKIIEQFVLSVKPKTIVDIGCNRGELSYGFKNYGMRVIGIDISSKKDLQVPEDYEFIQMNIAESDLPIEADVILFLSVYHHLVFNYDLKKADDVFFKLLSKTFYLVFDSGHPEEKGIYRQGWISKLRQYFSTEKELLEHFKVPYQTLGRWRTSQGDYRTIVAFKCNR